MSTTKSSRANESRPSDVLMSLYGLDNTDLKIMKIDPSFYDMSWEEGGKLLEETVSKYRAKSSIDYYYESAIGTDLERTVTPQMQMLSSTEGLLEVYGDDVLSQSFEIHDPDILLLEQPQMMWKDDLVTPPANSKLPPKSHSPPQSKIMTELGAQGL
ncbi:hypothetical protein TWF481_012198 [Arthrobotrys musiformis]|uniref:Uncharacterized protein n=1 Tax=Arthrobotrys musiformis TaxID=47236 RepID=A0AAV9VXR5_9PEZI